MLVEVGVDLDRAGVQPGLVRERRRADVGLARGRRDVGDLGDGVRDAGRLVEQALRQHAAVQLELEVGDDGDEVGVAGALAVAVDAALHVARAGGDRGQRVGDGAAGVVVGVDADPGAGRLDHVEHDVGDPVGQHAAVGVAERDDLGAGLGGGAQHLQRVRPVGAVAVEEVLGVEEHRLPLLAQVGDGVAHHREVLLERRAQRELDVAVVRLGDEGDHARPGVAEGGDQRVVGGAYAGPAGGAERRELRVGELELLARAAEELGVLRVRARPAALDVAHAEPVELAGDAQLVGDREVEPLLLGAVAQGGVVDVERAVQVHRSSSRSSGFRDGSHPAGAVCRPSSTSRSGRGLRRLRPRNVKKPPGVQEVGAAGSPVALGNDDRAGGHELMVPPMRPS